MIDDFNTLNIEIENIKELINQIDNKIDNMDNRLKQLEGEE